MHAQQPDRADDHAPGDAAPVIAWLANTSLDDGARAAARQAIRLFAEAALAPGSAVTLPAIADVAAHIRSDANLRLRRGDALTPDDIANLHDMAALVRHLATAGYPLAHQSAEAARQTDHVRWWNAAAFPRDWESRTIALPSLIPPGVKHLVEFGAGREYLANHLPPHIEYTPSDLVKRSERTLVLDLNDGTVAAMPAADAYLFGGVLEYVSDLPALVARFHAGVRYVICSYIALPRAAAAGKVAPSRGRANHIAVSEFVAIFENEGYLLRRLETYFESVKHPAPHFLFERPPRKRARA